MLWMESLLWLCMNIGPLSVAAFVVRRWFHEDEPWDRWLVGIVVYLVCISLLVTITLWTGWFHRWVLAGIGLGLGIISGRNSWHHHQPTLPITTQHTTSIGLVLMLVLVGIISCGALVMRLQRELSTPTSQGDMLGYHLPTAALWVITGSDREWWICDYLALPFYQPKGWEQYLAWLMVVFRHDALVPLVNLPVMALTVLAIFALTHIGQPPHQTRIVGVAWGAVFLLQPAVLHHQFPLGKNDLATAAYLLVALYGLLKVLVVRQPWRWQIVSALAVGLAVGNKVNGTLMAALLMVGWLVECWSRHRLSHRQIISTVVVWVMASVVLGGKEYLRMWWYTGSFWPYDRPIARSIFFEALAEPEFARQFLNIWLPWTGYWPLFVPMGIVLTRYLKPQGWDNPISGLLVWSTFWFLVVYVVTPQTAVHFTYPMVLPQIRFALPFLALCYVWAARACLSDALSLSWFALFAGLVSVDSLPRFAMIEPHWLKLFAIGIVSVVIVWGAWKGWHRWQWALPAFAGVGVLFTGVMVAPLTQYQERSRDQWYQNWYADQQPLWAWCADQLHGQRIAYSGHWFGYPLFGRDLANHVNMLALLDKHGRIVPCPDESVWLDYLRWGKVDYVVLDYSLRESADVAPWRWARNHPELLEEVYQNRNHQAVYRVNHNRRVLIPKVNLPTGWQRLTLLADQHTINREIAR